jgi:protoporphyrinogen/coproporphyrinogen III oxidase
MTGPVVVVGGGVTGVTAAWTLHRAGVDVALCEGADRLGGKLLLGSVAGQPAELGADAFLARNPAAGSLARRLGLGDDLVAPATSNVWLWLDGRLRPLPAGTVLGAPTDPIALARSGVLSPAALARAGLDLVLPRTQVTGDRSVATLVGERFGSAVVDTLVEPLLGGVYAGNPNHLSAEATVPQIASAAREHRSLLRGLRAARRATPPTDGPVFQTLAGGLERLVSAMAVTWGIACAWGSRWWPSSPVPMDGRSCCTTVTSYRQRTSCWRHPRGRRPHWLRTWHRKRPRNSRRSRTPPWP